MVKIEGEQVNFTEVKPGELFSAADPEFYNLALNNPANGGASVFIRTNKPVPAGKAPEKVWRLTIVEDEEDTKETPKGDTK